MVDAPSQLTPRGKIHYPAHSQDPKWIDNYFKVMAQDIEKIAVAKFATLSARDIGIPDPAAGDCAWITESLQLQVFDGTAWKVVYPAIGATITHGTVAPTGGADGDIYFQII